MLDISMSLIGALALAVVLDNRVNWIRGAGVVTGLRIPCRLVKREPVKPDDLLPRQAIGKATAHAPRLNAVRRSKSPKRMSRGGVKAPGLGVEGGHNLEVLSAHIVR